ncbi:PDZ/DHR/GLGF domain protein, partial [Ancylostoma caninum]
MPNKSKRSNSTFFLFFSYSVGKEAAEASSGEIVKERTSVVSPTTRDGVPRKVTITRDTNGHLGLSIAGGLGSTPFIDGDCSLFVSRVTPDGPADVAGLRVNDKLMKVNDVDVTCASHDEAVR